MHNYELISNSLVIITLTWLPQGSQHQPTSATPRESKPVQPCAATAAEESQVLGRKKGSTSTCLGPGRRHRWQHILMDPLVQVVILRSLHLVYFPDDPQGMCQTNFWQLVDHLKTLNGARCANSCLGIRRESLLCNKYRRVDLWQGFPTLLIHGMPLFGIAATIREILEFLSTNRGRQLSV